MGWIYSGSWPHGSGGDGVEDANMIRQVASDLAVSKCPKDVGQTELNEGLLELGN
jgi:hypothetical protein